MFLQSWLLFPVVLVVLSLGAGLLVERIARPAVPGALVLPLGLALVIVVSALFTYLDATAELAAPAVAVLGVAGLVAGLPRLKAAARAGRGLAWPAVAGLLPAAAVAAPVVLTGDAGFTGYARIVDLAFQVDFAAYLQDAGRQMPAVVDSSYLSVVQKMIAVRYPGGAQSALGAVASLTGLDPLWAWQPFIALLAACLGLSLFSVLRVAIPLAPLRAVAAGIAAQATALYAYALVAGIKELAAAAFLVLVAALLAAHRPGDGAWRQVVPAAVAIAAAFSVINVGILPWLGIYAGLFFVLDLTRRRALRVRVLANWVLLGVLAGVLALPALAGSLTIATVAAAGGPGGLGNLAAPVPVWSTAGVWLTSDYRFPLAVSGYETATYALIAITLAFAALGLLRAIATRDWPLIGLGAAGAIAVAYIVWKAEPWSEFKAFTISAPLMLTLAFAGAAALWRAAPRPGRAGDRPRPGRAVARASAVAALLAGGVIGLGVLAGNAMTYHGTSLAPTGSLAELQRIGDRYAGQGPTLYPVFDEYGEYLLRDARANSIVNPLRGETGLRPTAVPGVQFVREPDEYELAFLNRHRLLVLRRDPTASRPPSNWRRIDRTRHYEVWRRT
ncbi:MAG: hypothetical protein QOC64_3094, partial [Solirubrobacteraceae bacterium]|nr:hypothetical protein [Solirubrobacteraceae bacterium]